MKVLYSKFNSERNPAFQLRTIIFEQDGKRYVKKEALNDLAVSHVESLVVNRKALMRSIRDERCSIVPIMEHDNRSVTFAFIEGVAIDRRVRDNLHDKKALLSILEPYLHLLNEGFDTTEFDHTLHADETFRTLFGENDYSVLNGKRAFADLSNIDTILSNIIVTPEGNTCIIDYEWTFPVTVPVDFVLYRTVSQLPSSVASDLLEHFELTDPIYERMERHFIDRYVMRDGFYFYRHRYMKVNLPLTRFIQEKDEHIRQLKAHVEAFHQLRKIHNELQDEFTNLSTKLHATGEELTYARALVAYRDKQLEAARLKNRFRRLIGRIIPSFMPEELPSPPTPVEIKTNTGKTYRYEEPLPPSDHVDFATKPLISILMPVYNVDPLWLDRAVASVKAQWYDRWELCIVDDKSTNRATLAYLRELDDPRIKIRFGEINKNIAGASNDAAAMATGEYIALLDNDDELTPDALFEMVKAINETNADFLYSDEDFIDTEGRCFNPHFKPDFSPDLLLSHNYITHLACFKRSLFDDVGGFDERFSGSQDYDLFLRMSEKAKSIHHISKVLYHWRTIEGSTSADSKAKPEALEISKQVLEETLRRRGIDGWVENANIDHYFRVRYTIKGSPLVSIVIPFKDKPELLEMCLNSLLQKTTYPHFEIIGISNNSVETKTFETMKRFEAMDPRIRFYEYNVPFNYAAINNYAVETYAKGEHILLLNNDIEIISPEWIEAMLEHSQRDEIGCVGAKLYYPDDTIQHAGIIIGLGGYAGHSHKHYPRDSWGYFNRLNVVQNVSAVTAACLMIEKRIYQEVGGMDEEKFKVAYNDVDFCLRVLKAGYRNLFTPYAEMYHHESVSRGYETTPEKQARFQKEKDALFERHRDILTHGDPYYNPNLTHDDESFTPCLK